MSAKQKFALILVLLLCVTVTCLTLVLAGHEDAVRDAARFVGFPLGIVTLLFLLSLL